MVNKFNLGGIPPKLLPDQPDIENRFCGAGRSSGWRPTRPSISRNYALYNEADSDTPVWFSAARSIEAK
jgi:hypothetical protein